MNKVDFSHVRAEIQLLEKNDFANLKSDTARLAGELDRLRLRLAEELRRVQSNVRLELSIEKGRIRDEQSAQELKIKEADAKIDSEVAQIKTQMETVQWDLFKTLFPLFCAAGALAFSYLRGLEQTSETEIGLNIHHSKKLYISNLTKNVTEKHLREIFSEWGTLVAVQVPTADRLSVNRGYAYLEYDTAKAAENAAVRMNGGQLDGMYLKVSLVTPRAQPERAERTENMKVNGMTAEEMADAAHVVEREAHLLLLAAEQDGPKEPTPKSWRIFQLQTFRSASNPAQVTDTVKVPPERRPEPCSDNRPESIQFKVPVEITLIVPSQARQAQEPLKFQSILFFIQS
ncbi:hypothetical protein HDU96_002656 [Phlyctochytrium bullatum]|nr:hypothetical protein HDU96_002656 [Phlyctochytrium bullatum]